MAFDPDAYLAKSKPFDPDAYLARGTATPEQTPSALSGLAKSAVGLVEPGPQTVPGQGFLQKLATATKEQFAPSMDGVKRLFSPQVGQFGLSRLAQEAGEKVQGAVAGVSPTAAQVLPPLTPRSAAEQVGGEVAGAGVGRAAQFVDKTVVAPFNQLLTGIPGKEWLRLSEKIGMLKPSFLGGAPSKVAAGTAQGAAEEAAGLFGSSIPTGLGKSHVDKYMEVFRGMGTPKEIADPKFVDEVVKTLTPQEAMTLREATSNTLNEWVSGKDSKEYRRYAVLKDALNKYMGEISPVLRKAQEVYGDSAQRAKFLSIFPRTKYGEPAIGRLGFTGAAMVGAGGVGGGDIGDRLQRAGTVLAVTSPLSHATARVAAKTPTARLGFQAILAKYRADQKGKK